MGRNSGVAAVELLVSSWSLEWIGQAGLEPLAILYPDGP